MAPDRPGGTAGQPVPAPLDDGPKWAEDFRQQRFEERGGNDRFLGRSTFWQSFGRGNSSVTIHSYDRVPNRPGREEVYQLVSFRVRLGNSHQWSNWTRWEMSQVARIR